MKLHYQHYPVVSVQNYVSNPTNQLGPLMEALVTAGPQARVWHVPVRMREA